MTDLQVLGYHPAYQPGPGETYQTYTRTHEYSRAENIATGVLLTGALFPVAAAATIGFVGRVYWRIATRYAGHIVLAGPAEQMARNKAIDTWVRRGQTAHNIYTLYTHFTQSPASSSSSYQQNGGAGGTYKIPGSPSKFTGAFKDGHNDKWRGVTSEWISNPCRKGFRPDKIKGAWVCRRGSWSSYVRDLKAGRL